MNREVGDVRREACKGYCALHASIKSNSHPRLTAFTPHASHFPPPTP